MTKIEQVKEALRDRVMKDVRYDKMETGSGIMFDPLEAEVDKFDIKDIAHALSNICRWGGHTRFHYSVAQHSYIMSYLIDEKYAFEALMHDTPEAYLGDIPTPIKDTWREYKVLEDRLVRNLSKKYSFIYPFPEEVKIWDKKMKTLEYNELMRKDLSIESEISKMLPEEIEKLFIKRFKELSNERK
jgi:hypothetical protein